MGAVPDLNSPIIFRNVELNNLVIGDVPVNGKLPLVGSSVDWFDPTDVEVRQFTEPLALQDGIDVGGVWLGARRLAMRGTTYDMSRGQTFERLGAIEAVMLPERGTFGYYPLTWYTVSGAGESPIRALMSIDVRPGGLRYAIVRDDHGGGDDDPLAIRWAVNFYAKRPAIEDVTP